MSVPRALLIVDHGSHLPEANEMIAVVAKRIRSLRPELIVEHAHMEIASPNIAAGMAACVAAGAREVIVHPFLLAPGRHTRETIPERVAEAADGHPDIRIRLTAPLGPHDALADLVLIRLDEVLENK